MKKVIISMVLVLILSLIFVACGGTEGSDRNSSEPGSIYGVVTDNATSDLIKNASVELKDSEEKLVAASNTGSEGNYYFDKIAAGSYTLHVTKFGYYPATKSVIVETSKETFGDVLLAKAPAALQIVDDKGNEIKELDFGMKPDDVSRSFNIFNDSSDVLDWKITTTAEWIKSVSEESGELNAGKTLGIIVVIDRSLLREGENLSQLHVTSNNGHKQLEVKATDSDACKNNPCGEHGTCKATGVKTYKCICDEGYFSNEIKCVDPCSDEPCIGVKNATGKCVAKDAFSYSCECNDSFSWNGNNCLNPCDPNPCEEIEHSNGKCNKLDDFSKYSCGCEDNYAWENSSCVGAKRTYSCNGLPEHAVWNTVSSYTQTWNGTSWFPPDSSAAYSEAESTTECRFKCKVNYNWNSSTSTCDAAKQTVNCTAKPANAVWNTVSTVTQTWNGSAWVPSNISTYNTTASTNECRYKCDIDYYWYNSECLNPCDNEPCAEVANSTKVCTASSWNQYSCSCNQNLVWNGSQCVIPECSPTNPTPCIDSSTGYMWSAIASATKTWADAKTYCNNLREGGYSNWHLPTIDELRSLIQNCTDTEPWGTCGVTNNCLLSTCYDSNVCRSCSEDSSGGHSKFGETISFWSSSKYQYVATTKLPCIACYLEQVWVVEFLQGSILAVLTGDESKGYFRCVRN